MALQKEAQMIFLDFVHFCQKNEQKYTRPIYGIVGTNTHGF